MGNLLDDYKVSDEKKSAVKKQSYDIKFDDDLTGYYLIDSFSANVRPNPSMKKTDPVLKCIIKGERIYCDGKFADVDGKRWLHISSNNVTGFILSNLLKKL